MNTVHPVPAIVQANTLLERMLAGAHRAGDVGREFVIGGVRRLVVVEISFRVRASGEATAIGNDIAGAENLIASSLANDGTIDAAEATCIRAALRKPERSARHLAAELSVPCQQ